MNYKIIDRRNGLITACLFVTLWLAMGYATWAGVTYLSH